jgi:hypothetical protein
MFVLSPISTSWDTIPMKEKIKVPPEPGTVILYDPSASVTEPVVLPFTTTLTPGKVEPSSAEVTLPDTTRSCARIVKDAKTNEKHNSKIFFIGFGLVF